MNVDLKDEEKVSFLVSLCKNMGLKAEEILAMYLSLGDRIFFLFDLLQGVTVKFPSMRTFHHSLSLVGRLRLLKLKSTCVVNGVESYRESIVLGDTVSIDGVDFEALSLPINFYGSFYLLVKDSQEV